MSNDDDAENSEADDAVLAKRRKREECGRAVKFVLCAVPMDSRPSTNATSLAVSCTNLAQRSRFRSVRAPGRSTLKVSNNQSFACARPLGLASRTERPNKHVCEGSNDSAQCAGRKSLLSWMCGSSTCGASWPVLAKVKRASQMVAAAALSQLAFDNLSDNSTS